MTTVSIFSDTVASLGEGPTAHPALGRLFWFDILGRRLLEKPLAGAGTLVHDLPFNGSVLAAVDDGRQLIVGSAGLFLRDVATGALTLVKALDLPGSLRTNDGRVHPCGALWFSTMGRHAEDKAGAFWWFFKGEVRQLFPDMTVPNACCFAADGSAAFFADSRRRTIWRVATDPATGLPIGEPAVFQAPSDDPDAGGPDGAVMDADGLIWNARWGVGRLDAYAPDGRRVHAIAIPAKQSTCPAFIGRNADRLVVTTAREGLDAAAVAADPLAGLTFLVDLPVNGRFDPPVKLA